jgi:hypothetical protein
MFLFSYYSDSFSGDFRARVVALAESVDPVNLGRVPLLSQHAGIFEARYLEPLVMHACAFCVFFRLERDINSFLFANTKLQSRTSNIFGLGVVS